MVPLFVFGDLMVKITLCILSGYFLLLERNGFGL